MKKLLLTLLVASPSLLFAQGNQVNTQSVKALGVSGAGSALFVDETSIFYNPGALVKMEGNAASVGAAALMYRTAFTPNGGATHDSNFKISPPFAAFATFGPSDAWWKAGLGVYTPFGGSIDWGNEWAGRFELNEVNLRAIYIQPTFSFKLTDNFSLGAGFVYNIGQVNLSRSLPLPGNETGQAELKGTGTGMGYNVGAFYTHDDFAISLSYRSSVRTKVDEGDATFNVPTAFQTALPNTTFASELPLPATFNVGFTTPIGEKVDFVADVSFIGYDIYRELAFDYAQNTPQLTDTREVRNYRNAGSFKAGLNIEASEKFDFRFGGGYVATPVGRDYVSAETPDNNRYMVSGGFTAKLSDKFDLNAAYTYQRILERTSSVGSPAGDVVGAYKTNIHVPALSLVFKY